MEDFVTFEQAVKLKKLEFDWKCYTFYHSDNWCGLNHSGMYENHNMFKKCVSAPTLSQAQKWLRNIHKIEVWICMDFDGMQPKGTFGCEIRKFDAEFGDDIDEIGFSTYEEALSFGISKALELLNI